MIGLKFEFLGWDSYGNVGPSNNNIIGTIVDKVIIGNLFRDNQSARENPECVTAYLVKLDEPNWRGREFELCFPEHIIRQINENK